MLHHLFGRKRNMDVGLSRVRRTATLTLEALEVRENPVAFYVVPGAAGTSTALDFGWLAKDAAYFSEIGVYQVDDGTGAVDGVAPSGANYAETALAGATTVFTRGQGERARNVQTFAAGTVLGFYMVQNTSLAVARAVNPTNAALNNGAVVLFSFPGASPDQFDHAQFSVNGTETVVRFEDGLRGGDGDFNDAVIRVRTLDPNIAAGGAGQVTPTAFRLNQRKGAFHSEIGVYAFDDASGTVGGVRPGDPNYAAAVLRSANRTVLFGRTAGVGTVAGANLPGGGNFGYYLIQNADAATFLQLNPANNINGTPVMFFSQSNANPDATVHVRQNGNSVHFEDGLRGGDQDFNDAVFSFVSGVPVTVAAPAVPPAAPAPTAPTISAIADQTVNQNIATAALPFTVGSTSTAPANLAVTASSSNTALVPNANIALGGSGADRTVTVTPAAGQSGTAAITLTVSDGTRTATQTFNVTVLPLGAPSFTASNPPTANFNAGAQAVANFATFVPGQNGGGTTPTYTVTNVSNPGLFTTAPAVASNGTLTYTPKPGGFGSSTFTVRASDGTNSSGTQTFTITVSPVQGLNPTTIPGANPAIDLADANWVAIPTVVAAGNSAGIPAGTVADGTRVQDLVNGNGATVARGNQVNVTYVGYRLDGTIFDQNTATFTASETALIPGFAAGLIGTQVGDTRNIDIASYLAYGASSAQVGQANARLVFRITVNAII